MECRNIRNTFTRSTKSTKQVRGKKHQEESTLQRKIRTCEIYESRVQSPESIQPFSFLFYRNIKQTGVKLKTQCTKY